MRSLKRLNLVFNMTGRAGASSLAALLAGRASGLEELSLRRTAVDAEGALALIDALADNSTLTTLNLSDNALIDDGGWESILERVLRLVYDTLSMPGAMRSNHSLSSLSEPYVPGVPGSEEPSHGRHPAPPPWLPPPPTKGAGTRYFVLELRRRRRCVRACVRDTGRRQTRTVTEARWGDACLLLTPTLCRSDAERPKEGASRGAERREIERAAVMHGA